MTLSSTVSIITERQCRPLSAVVVLEHASHDVAFDERTELSLSKQTEHRQYTKWSTYVGSTETTTTTTYISDIIVDCKWIGEFLAFHSHFYFKTKHLSYMRRRNAIF